MLEDDVDYEIIVSTSWKGYVMHIAVSGDNCNVE